MDKFMQLASYLDEQKMATPLKIGAIATPGFMALEHYVFNDWEFLAFLCLLIVLDTVTGVWKSIKYHRISSSAFGRLFEKIVVYGIALIVIHALTTFPKSDTAKAVFGWVEHLGYAAFMVREGISIFENLGAIRPQLIPPFILKRLRNFNETGQFDPGSPSDNDGAIH